MNRSVEIKDAVDLQASFVLALSAYLAGKLLAPLVYPYKLFVSDSPAERLTIQLASLARRETFFGPNALAGYAGFVIIFAISLTFFRSRRPAFVLPYYLLLGGCFAVMIEGNRAGYAHASFDQSVGKTIPLLTDMPFYLLFPLIIMLGLPLLIAFAASRVEAAATGANAG